MVPQFPGYFAFLCAECMKFNKRKPECQLLAVPLKKQSSCICKDLHYDRDNQPDSTISKGK